MDGQNAFLLSALAKTLTFFWIIRMPVLNADVPNLGIVRNVGHHAELPARCGISNTKGATAETQSR